MSMTRDEHEALAMAAARRLELARLRQASDARGERDYTLRQLAQLAQDADDQLRARAVPRELVEAHQEAEAAHAAADLGLQAARRAAACAAAFGPPGLARRLEAELAAASAAQTDAAAVVELAQAFVDAALAEARKGPA